MGQANKLSQKESIMKSKTKRERDQQNQGDRGVILFLVPLASLSLMCVHVSLCSEVRTPTGNWAGSLASLSTLSSCCLMWEAGAMLRTPSGESYSTSTLNN